MHPAEPLQQVPYVIAEATPVNLSGFHLSDSEYKRYLDTRDVRIERAVSSTGGGGFGGGGGHPLVLVAAIPIYLMVVVAAKGRAHGKAADTDRVLEPEETARLSRLLANAVTGAALAERTGRRLYSNLGATVGWLQVSVKSVEQRLYPDARVALAFRAEAQAIAPDGTASPPSQHFVLIAPKGGYSAHAWRDGAVEDDLNRALDMLAASIASTYMPERVGVPAQRYELQGGARVVSYTMGLREFFRDYDAR